MREGQPAEQSAQFCIGNSPRTRGGQPKLITAKGIKDAFSPHARGSTLCHCAKTDKRGFSPHARGSTLPDCNIPQRNAILPACAGVNPVPRLHWRAIQDSPRMRGGQPVSFEPRPLRTQFPPHARGSTRRTIGTVLVLVILPACAGVNPAPPVLSKGISDSPRMRGGQPARIVLMTLEAQFSPHVRGSTHETDTVNSDGMIHPACAGVTLSREWLYEPVYSPRMRGGQPFYRLAFRWC